MHEPHSPINQRVKDKLVKREVIHNASHLIASLMTIEPEGSDWWDDLHSLAWNHACWPRAFGYDEGEDEEGHEVFEHWIVTPWLAERLAAKGESCAEIYDFWIWGRTTTGQSISVDSVIHDIAVDMEILDGQMNHRGRSR